MLRRIANPSLFRQTLTIAVNYPAQEISFIKMLGQLQEQGNVSTIKNYLEYLESAYLIRLIYKYSTNTIKSRTSSPKILPLAGSLVTAFKEKEEIDRDKT